MQERITFYLKPLSCPKQLLTTDAKGSIQLIGNWTKTVVISEIQGLSEKIIVDSYMLYGDNLVEVSEDSFLLTISLNEEYNTKAQFVFSGDGTDVVGKT